LPDQQIDAAVEARSENCTQFCFPETADLCCEGERCVCLQCMCS